MTLGAEDVQAAELDDFFVLGRRSALEVREDALPVGARDPVEAIDVEEVDELLIVDELLFALRQLLARLLPPGLLPRHVLGVAAKQNVGAAAGHVRGDRDVALAAGLRDDFGFLRVVLGVQHDVLDAALACSMVESRSDFSIETVPTSVGRPASCFSRMSSTIALYFSRSVR